MRRFSPQAVVFDMDGVLVDSMPQIAGIIASWARSHRLDPEEVVRCSRGRTDVELVALVAPHLDPHREAATINECECLDAIDLAPVLGARAFVADVARAGLPWAVVTSSTRAVAWRRLACTGFPTPPVLVTADDVVHGKPHPEPYARAAVALGHAPRHCVAVEDSESGARSGVAAGMTVVGLATDHDRRGPVPGATVTARGFADLTLRPDRRLDVRTAAMALPGGEVA